MKRKLFSLMILCASPIFLFSQGDNCNTATYLPDVTDFCSGDGAYTNAAATASAYTLPSCWAVGSTQDVWFSFVATGTDVLGSVAGTTAGGTMTTPCVVLYTGTCNATMTLMTEMECATGNGIAEFYQAGLIPGTTYFIRVSSTAGSAGTFRLCVNNYTPESNPGADCDGATHLCSKSTIGVSQFSGGGNNTNEPTNEPGTCFVGSESNSVWYTWKCEAAGTLLFDIIPLNATKDIDFVLYQLTGTDPCGGRSVIRCNVASCLNASGSTGLNATDSDLSEGAGCIATSNAYCKYVDMTAGTSYALLINNADNFSGFNLSWGGTGTFAGPLPVINMSEDTICEGGSVTFDGIGSANVSGGLEWTFSGDGAPATQSGQGPHQVTYPVAGNYVALLEGTDAGGCSETKNANVTVLPIPGANILPSGPIQGNPGLVVNFENGSTGGTSYTWNFGNGQTATTTDVNQDYPVAYNDLGTYVVTLTATNGFCSSSDNETVIIGFPPIVIVNIPNVITPDNDGTNDLFTIKTEYAKSLEIVVTNRWGETIKKFDGLTQSWDGKAASGGEAAEGVYFFTYTGEGFEGTKLEGHGFVELFR